VVRGWSAGLASARSALATVLTTSSSGPRAPVNVQTLVKPLVDIVQRYPDAGASLLSRTFEALADADILFEPGSLGSVFYAAVFICSDAHVYFRGHCRWAV
jgi:hypothetical protein